MRVAWIIDHLGQGGAQRQLLEVGRLLPRDQVSLQVVSLSTRKTDYAAPLRDAGIQLTLVPQGSKFSSFSTCQAVAAILSQLQPDVVQTWLFEAGVYGRLAALWTRCPVVVAAVRNTIDDLKWHHRLVTRLLSYGTTCTTVNADAMRSGFVSLGIPESKIRTIRNGIDLRVFPRVPKDPEEIESWGIPNGSTIVAMAARMAPQKDYVTFLRAAKLVVARAPNTYFLLIGDGPDRGHIEATIRELGIQTRAKLLGVRHDVWTILNNIDIFVLSTHFEGCSNVIMEAMAAGKPVVATPAGGNAELVSDGRTGLMTPIGDPRAMADRILELILNRELARSMGIAGRKKIEDEFSIERTVSETVALYQELRRGIPQGG
jgi:glycosyltransferase involved in cell wall biosynthesis